MSTSTFLFYGFAFIGESRVEAVLTQIIERIGRAELGTIAHPDSYILDPQSNPIVWNTPALFNDEIIVEKQRDYSRNVNVLLIYPKNLKYNAELGVTTIDTNANRESWGAAEIFGVLAGFDTFPQYHLVSLKD